MSSAHPRTRPQSVHARALVILSMACALLTACGSNAPNGPAAPRSDANGDSESATDSVLVTTSIWADVVDHITCSTPGTFQPLIPPGADPHEYQPSIADAETMEAASLIIANGEGLEEALEPLVDQAEAGGVTVIRLTEALDAGSGDPHLWLDPTITIAVVRALVGPLTAAGLDADEIAECSDTYVDTLEQLDADLTELVATIDESHRKLVTNHDALGRFADHYGFEIIGTVLPSTSSMAQANPADLEELAERIEAEDVPAIFTEGGHEGEDAVALAGRIGVEVVQLQTDALGSDGSGFDTYVDLMRTNTERIVAALGARSE